MPHVSLIIAATREVSESASDIAAARQALESAGHSVEVVVGLAAGVSPASLPRSEDVKSEPTSPWILAHSTETGRTAAAIAGLQVASGDLLLVLNPDRGYNPAELVAVLNALNPANPEVVVASRLARDSVGGLSAMPMGLLGRFLRLMSGTSDPLSGLVGLSRPALTAALPRFEEVGSQFTLELLAKVPGPKREIPAQPRPQSRSRLRPRFEDVRHVKHLADHRFGNASRLMQFCAVGASGMVVDLTCYAALQEVFYGIPWMVENAVPPTRVPWALATARAMAIGVALIWNFSLNRRMTFSYARGGSILRQFITYVLSNLLGVSVSMMLSLGLPSRVEFFQNHKLVAAVVGIVAATGISFSMSRWIVFRRSVATSPLPLSGLSERIVRHDSALIESPTAR